MGSSNRTMRKEGDEEKREKKLLTSGFDIKVLLRNNTGISAGDDCDGRRAIGHDLYLLELAGDLMGPLIFPVNGSSARSS